MDVNGPKLKPTRLVFRYLPRRLVVHLFGVHAMAEPSQAHLRTLRAVFRKLGFRGLQYDAIQATLSGSDSFVLLPTGAGKSLTYQFPACVKKNAFTLVITPTLSLMKDQVDKARELGLHVAVWNGQQTRATKRQVLADLRSPHSPLKLLYTSPESLYSDLNPELLDALKLAYQNRRLFSVAIDEAHLIIEWGLSFREKYLSLKRLKIDFPGVPISALSASVTPEDKERIINMLPLDNPVVVNTSFNRPNIQYKVHMRHTDLPMGDFNHLVNFINKPHPEAGIIYCNTRRDCDLLAERLQGVGVTADVVHRGKGDQHRISVQDKWAAKECNLVIATTAFGLGIDRADVRWVVHWGAPFTMERYLQESGRAGRDGHPSVHVVYACEGELWECGQWSGKEEGAAQVAALCTQDTCRRVTLLKHFGEDRDPCGTDVELFCDICARQRVTEAAEAEEALEAEAASAEAAAATAIATALELISDSDDTSSSGSDSQDPLFGSESAKAAPAAQQSAGQHQAVAAGVLSSTSSGDSDSHSDSDTEDSRESSDPDSDAAHPPLATPGRSGPGNAAGAQGTQAIGISSVKAGAQSGSRIAKQQVHTPGARGHRSTDAPTAPSKKRKAAELGGSGVKQPGPQPRKLKFNQL